MTLFTSPQTTNRIGNVPAYFYDDLPHIGYDIDGKKVMRPATGDELDKFLEGIEDADGGWCVAFSLRTSAELSLTRFLLAGLPSRTSFTGKTSLSPRKSLISSTVSPRERTPTPPTTREFIFGAFAEPLTNSASPRSYTPTIEYFSSKVLATPLVGRPEPKSRFLPSKWEHKKVRRLSLSEPRQLANSAPINRS